MSRIPAVVSPPTLDRYDLAALLACLFLFFLAFVVYPVEQLQIPVILVTFTITLAWVGYLLQRWAFES